MKIILILLFLLLTSMTYAEEEKTDNIQGLQETMIVSKADIEKMAIQVQEIANEREYYKDQFTRLTSCVLAHPQNASAACIKPI